MAVASLVVASCSSSTGGQTPPIVEVGMREYSFDYHAPTQRGRVVFHMVNRGRLAHRLALVPLAEDFPPIRDQLQGTQRRFITEVAGIPDRPPGSDGTFAADLKPGRYAFICFSTDPGGRTHASQGMAAEFRIR
ncbi:MAG: hypothetical protein ABR564_09580 [Candidatus Dormibacteria bacterium]